MVKRLEIQKLKTFLACIIIIRYIFG